MKGIIVIVLLPILTFCTSKEENYIYDQTKNSNLNTLNKYLQVEKNIEDYYCIIIPIEGCNDCIEKILRFLEDNKGKFIKKTRIILTGYSLKKIYQIRSLDIIKQNQYILDNKGKALDLGLVNSFPVWFYIGKNKLKESLEINTANLNKIPELLTKKQKI